MAGGYFEHVVVLSGLNAIMALGFYVTFLTGQLSAAHAAFMGVGGYAAGVLATKFGVPFYTAVASACVVAGLGAAVLAVALGRLSGMFFAIATLAFTEVLIVLLKNADSLGGALGLYGVPLRTQLWHVGIVLAALVFAFARFEDSRLGLAFRAVRDDPVAAAATGIHVAGTRVFAFVLGAILSALGGAMQVFYLGVIEPDSIGFFFTVSLLLFTVVGGRDYFAGPILGAVIFTVLPEILRVTIHGRLVIFSLLLILIVILRPDGLIGRAQVRWLMRSRGGEAASKP